MRHTGVIVVGSSPAIYTLDSMLYSLGLQTVRFRWVILVAWVVLVAFAIVFAPRATTVLKSGFGDIDMESSHALEILQEQFGYSEASLTLAFHRPDGDATSEAFISDMELCLAPLREAPEVSNVITHYTAGNPNMVSSDRHTTYVLVQLHGTIDEAMDSYSELRDLIVAPPGMVVLPTGAIPIFSDLNEASERDLRRAEMYTFPVVLLVLVFVFGSVVAAALPVAVGGVSVILTLALIYLVGEITDLSVFVLNIVTLLGLGIAIDYSLLVVTRFREELQRRSKSEAIAVTVSYAGRAILSSGITTILGFSGLLFFDLMMLRSIGIGGILVLILSMLLALSLIPALLAVLGARVNALALLKTREDRESFWRRIAVRVMRRPLFVIVPVVIVLLILGTPFLHVRLGAPWASILPSDAGSRQGWELLSEQFGEGEQVPILVVLRAQEPILQSPGTMDFIYDFTRELERDERVARVDSMVTLNPNMEREDYHQLFQKLDSPVFAEQLAATQNFVQGDTAIINVFPEEGPMSDSTKGLVGHIRAIDVGEDREIVVGGTTASLMDLVELLYRNFPLVIIYIVVAVYLALLVFFRSVILPLKAVLLNTLSIFASYGALVFVFQDGHMSSLMGFQAVGMTDATIPILMFCMLFGLSMDYEVFLLARVKETYDKTGDNNESVAIGLERTGRIITSAAFVLFIVMGSFVMADILVVKALGVGMAVGILLDATVVRALLVPATMRILGRMNWWAPRPLREKTNVMFEPRDNAP